MWDRCTKPRCNAYSNYGGRGIRVAAEWKDIEIFYRDMEPSWRPGLTLERIENNGPYSAANCCWATRRVQNRNKRTNAYVETPVGVMQACDAVEMSGLRKSTLVMRARRGWPAERLFDPPRWTRSA